MPEFGKRAGTKAIELALLLNLSFPEEILWLSAYAGSKKS